MYRPVRATAPVVESGGACYTVFISEFHQLDNISCGLHRMHSCIRKAQATISSAATDL